MVLDTAAGTVPAGSAMCFGLGVQLGANVLADSPVPLPVVGLSSGVSVASMQPGSSIFSCAVFVGPSGWRQLRCTGYNADGQLGCGFIKGNSGDNQLTPCDAVGLPSPPDTSTQVKGVASSASHTVAWLDNGLVYASGRQPFNGQSTNKANFTRVANLTDVASCAAGERHTCCLTKTNSVWCWGDNINSQLGVNSSTTITSTPVRVAGISGEVVQLAAGSRHTAPLLSNGTVMSWGWNIFGQLGDGSTTNSYTPVLAVNLTNVAQISAGGYTTCAARLTNGDVRCWGDNFYGKVGQVGASCPNDICTTPQAQVPGMSGVASVTVGESHVCAVYLDKTASCWGYGGNGQLSGDTRSATSPGRVVMCEAPDCPAPPPTGGATSIASYPSCSTTPSAGIYSQGTACTATCAAGSSGGFAKCGLLASGAPVWQVTQCTPDCSSVGLPTLPNAEWSCGASVTAGGSCSGSCAAGFEGRLTAVCVGPSWSTTGNCTRVACTGPPPSGAPNATFQCASTPVGQPCTAVCTAGLTGSPRRVCLADGSWGALEGDACVDCAANQPKLTANQPSTSVAAGSTGVSTVFTFIAPFIKGTTTLLATLDGLIPCTTQPAELTGAATTPTAITVSCQVAAGISAGPHKIALKATTTGSNSCSSGSTTTLADILATSAPTPGPSMQLAAAGAAPSACKAAAGQPSTASVTFTYAVTPAAADANSGLALETEVAASAAGASCTATRIGGLEHGLLEVTCRGVFDSLTSLGISITLKASTPGSLEGSATSSQTVAFICCTAPTTLAHAVNTDAGSNCQTCGGSSSAVDGVWLRGGLQAGVMRAGAISSSTCSSANSADVGSITAVCDEQNNQLLRVTVTNPAGSTAAKVEFLTRCNIDTVTANMPSCTAPGPYRWRMATTARNSLNVTTSPAGEQVVSFSMLQTSTQASCTCGTSFFLAPAHLLAPLPKRTVSRQGG